MNIIPNSTQLLNMPDDLYFGNGLPGYLSNSKMGLINPAEGGSPGRFKNGFDQKSDSLKLGSAVHQLVLEGDYYKLADVDVPSDMVRKIMNTTHSMTTRKDTPLSFDEALGVAVKLHNYYKGKPTPKVLETLVAKSASYYAFLCQNHDDMSLVYLEPPMKIKCINSVSAVNKNKEAFALLNPLQSMEYGNHDIQSFNEYVITCKVIHDGKVVDLKAKMDNFTINRTLGVVTLNDLKTTSYSVDNFFGHTGLELENFALVPKLFKGSFQKYHYYRQMFMYSKMLEAYVKDTYPDEEFEYRCNMVVTETFGFKPSAKVYAVDEPWMELGSIEFDDLLTRILKETTSVKDAPEEDLIGLAIDEDDPWGSDSDLDSIEDDDLDGLD